MNFYHQKKKFYNLSANQIVPKSKDCTDKDKEVTMINNIYINESLTTGCY